MNLMEMSEMPELFSERKAIKSFFFTSKIRNIPICEPDRLFVHVPRVQWDKSNTMRFERFLSSALQ